MAGMMVRADMLAAMGTIGHDDVQAMEAQARGALADQVERIDIIRVVIAAQVKDGHISMIEVGLEVQRQISESLRSGT